jgi:hypothetical protein
MSRSRFARVSRLCSAACLSAALLCAQAAELGEVVVQSYIGQPLVADIELTALADPAAPVTVRLANADVYKGANIGMHPVLASLTMTVTRRDGRQFLHITSLKPVDTENVHLFLDLSEGSRRNVRAATLWLSRDPAPKPPPPPPPPPPAPAPLVSALPAPVRAAPAAEPVAAVERPRPARVISLPAATQACPPPKSLGEQESKACAATDYKNALLSAQIVELEEKIKQLQLAIDARAEAGPAPVAAAVAKPVPPPPPPPPKAAHKPAPKEQAAGFPWLLTAAIVSALALVGGAVWFWLSRRKGKSAEAAAADSVAWYTKLAARFKRKPKSDAEPVAEAAQDA